MTPKDSKMRAGLPARFRKHRLLVPLGAVAIAAGVVGCTAPISLDAGQSVPVSCKGTQLIVSQQGTSAQLTCDGTTNPYDNAVAAIPGIGLSARLDEASGTVAANKIAGKAAGTISGSAVTYGATDTVAGTAAGQKALKLGAGSSVSFPSTSAYNLSTTASNKWTVMLDVRVDATSGYPSILSKGNSATNGFDLFADPALNTVGLIVNGQQYAWDGISLATMSHLEVSWDGQNLTFSVNGQQLGQSAATAATVSDTSPLVLGNAGGLTVAKMALATSADPTLASRMYSVITSGLSAPTTTAPVGTTATTTPTTTATTAPPTTSSPTPTSPANGAKLIWSDEFNGPAGTGVDTSTWEQQVGAPTNAGRVEYLTAGTHNVAEDGKGNLVITARRESYGGREYTSGRIESLKNFTTGYLEFRAKVPTWQGTMPGLWTYGAAGYTTATQFSELDALEIQTGIDPTSVRQTIHGLAGDGSIWQLGWDQNRVNMSPARPGDAWHTYGVYVNPSDHSVTFYVDGVAKTHYYPGQQPSGGAWPYGSIAQKAIIEIEMGGYSGTPSTDSNSDTLQADYVRVYDKPPY